MAHENIDNITKLKLLLLERKIADSDIGELVEAIRQDFAKQANLFAMIQAELDVLRNQLTYHIDCATHKILIIVANTVPLLNISKGTFCFS